MSTFHHKPVMLQEVIDCLTIKPNGCYIDATFGRGGHSQAILEKLGPDGQLIVFDKDHAAISHAKQHFHQDARLRVVHACFSEIEKLLAEYKGKIDGILVDLGVSSAQLDDPSRGFSFRYEAELDMRMDHRQEETAASFLAKATKKDLSSILRRYGEEIDANRIADKIIEKRILKPIETTKELTDVVQEAKARYRKKIHPATQTFQAVRIHVNQELTALEAFLKQAPSMLNQEGVIAVISFHSLEDRMVKKCFNQLITPNIPRKLPILEKAIKKAYDWKVKRLKPSLAECKINPRARSATLRAIRKLMLEQEVPLQGS